MSDSATHRIVTVLEPGGPEQLQVVSRAVPTPAAGEILIRNAACGVNRPDQIERLGFYPAPAGAPEGLGLEVSGTVVALGDGVTEFEVGEAVCALVAGGGYSDFAVAPSGSVLKAPPALDLVNAAGLPETVFTVWANVFEIGKLLQGETFLVHGGSSGIGTTAIQMAKAAGATVIATAGSEDKCDLCRDLGADRAVNYKTERFEDVATEMGGVDVLLDMVGGDYVPRNIASMKPGGRIVSIAFLGGSRTEIDLRPVMVKRLTLTGSTLRARPNAEKARLARSIEETVWPWIAEGKLAPVVDSTYALDDVRFSHERLDSGAHSGKILLIP